MRLRLSQFALLIAYLGVVSAVMRFRLLDDRYSLFERLFETAIVALTPLNLVGPVRAVWVSLKGGGLSSGEILWAWVGMLWCWVWGTFHPHDRGGALVGLVVNFFLLAVLSTLLAAFGPRPPRQGKPWAHHAGWLILECDVLVWGLFAAPPP